MSIIYEALKKAEEKNNLRKPVIKKRKNPNFKVIFFVFVVLISTGAFYMIWQAISVLKSPSENGIIYTEETIDNKQVAINAKKIDKRKKSNKLGKAKKKVNAFREDIVYRLQGIVYDEDNPFAIINGKQIGVGQKVEEALLTRISHDGIEIQTEQGKVYIALDD
ncbi:MAG: hypothetical protein KKF54_07480 [Candidatus Omnitrophica bacterium]|nr:hypothetical protein [Candidatus Omnitrophota bacterium]